MAVITSTNFTGGAAGAAVTTTTEPIFTDMGGTPTYGVDKYGNKGMKHVSTAGHGGISMGGRTQIRVSFNYYRESGTQTAYLLLNAFRTAATVNVDMSVRNAGGGQPAARINFAWTDQLLTDAIDIGEQWHIENHWIQGEGLHVYLWKDGTPSTATWDYHLFGANTTYAPDNFRVGHSNAATGITGIVSQLVVTEGEQVWGVGAPVPGTLNYNLVGPATSTSFRTVAKTTDAVSVRIKVSTSADLATAPVFSTPVTPDADGYSKHEITGLSPFTKYYWATEVDDVVATTLSGEAWTLPTPGSQSNFTFWSGSCHDVTGSTVFGNIRARTPLFGVQLGDLGYQYITGGTNGNTAPSDVATVRAHRLVTIEGDTELNKLYRRIPFNHIYSDCDGAGANADKTWPGFVSGAVQAAYRQQFAHPVLPLADSGARSWVAGRIRCILTDENTMADNKDAVDDAAKSKLGTAQKQWFKDELLAAKAAGEAVFWFGDGPWLGGATSGTSNTWGRYTVERTELANFITSNQIRIIRIHGDDHSLYADNGTNNPNGGFPVICAAPMATTAQVYGGTVTNGKYPSVQTNSARQYGFYEVTDTGDAISLVYHGYAYTGTNAEVEQVTMTTTWNMVGGFTQPFTSVSIGSTPITSLYLGDLLIWSA